MELCLNKVSKRFGAFAAVDAVSLTMTGGVYGLLGVNGAGKTTLMRMLCTLLVPSAGSITYDGQDIFKMDRDYRALLGYLPQDFGYYPDFTVRDYLGYIAAIKGVRPVVARERVAQLIAQVGLEKAAGKKMKRLSGGMKRRVGIAQAMLNDPRVLILDEPTAGLDPNERIRFRNLISALATERLVLLSTHIVSDVEYIADEILLMKDGRILHRGTAQALTQSIGARVWQASVSREAVPQLAKRYQIANMHSAADGVKLRIVASERPTPDAVPLAATLEDVFLYYFGERGGDDHAAL
ncbi:MAG: ABC transporter ATP-binding protein [Peptococcaceae bacterium]|nr:ABC transporter ATP-binding protein [Peptococcaceae bacterium]